MLKYLGNGFIPGVPARDLTEEEARQFGKHRLVYSGLYKSVSERAKAVRPDYENKAVVPANDDKEE